MHKALVTALLASTVFLAHAAEPIPSIDDPAKIVVDGKKMTAIEFRDKYCIYDLATPSCNKVKRWLRIESRKWKPTPTF